jgi:hypothetical protein
MGSFRRRIVLAQRRQAAGGEVRAALEDDFHHFRVVVEHDGAQVLRLSGHAVRHPYTLCSSAVERLVDVVGMPLSHVAGAVTRVTDASEQCTHLLDLAGLAIALAATGGTGRRYDLDVADRVDGRCTAALARDGEQLLRWDLQDTTIIGPAPFAGVSLREGLARWALQTLPGDLAEAAIVLRRGALISLGRHKNLDAQRHAVPTGRCHAQQPRHAAQALRVVGSTWDFSARPAALCSEDAAWLAIAEPTA